MASTLTIRKLSPLVGSEVIGIDLTQPLDAEAHATLNREMGERVALVFRDQKLDARSFFEAAKLFGEPTSSLRESREKVDAKANIFEAPYVHQISSRDRNDDGSVKLTGQMWHTDMSGHTSPPKYTILHALELFHTGGGSTGLATARAAYEALPEAFKQRLDGMQTANTLNGTGALTEMDRQKVTEPAIFPLVRTNKDSGKKALYLLANRFEYFVGMNPEDSRELFDEILEHVLKPAYVYHHQWKVGDMLIWDNRSALHRANYDYDPMDMTQERLMYRVLIEGERPE